MSHHDQQFLSAPKKRVLDARADSEVRSAEQVQFIVKGQGIISSAAPGRDSLSWTIIDSGHTAGLRLEIHREGATLWMHQDGAWRAHHQYVGLHIGMDSDPACKYWYSLDCHNRRIRFGKGEARLKTTLVEFDFGPAPASGEDSYAWVSKVDSVQLAPAVATQIVVWRDPVTIEPALFVVPTELISMDDVALNNATVPANLTPACQMLYSNVAGPNFQLNTPDFPQFVDAIEASIRDEHGWCNQTLKSKASEFGGDNQAETYLRITMGANQGESPGIPYVMEIWPPGHYSPIHDHGGANAVIRVLNGEITVSLFAMLSSKHQQPYAQQVFRKDAVTWISPELNQFHQLRNHNTGGPTCITIQCYAYSDTNTTHYAYFDYINNNEIERFDPNSDMDFLQFKATMKQEWWARQRAIM